MLIEQPFLQDCPFILIERISQHLSTCARLKIYSIYNDIASVIWGYMRRNEVEVKVI